MRGMVEKEPMSSSSMDTLLRISSITSLIFAGGFAKRILKPTRGAGFAEIPSSEHAALLLEFALETMGRPDDCATGVHGKKLEGKPTIATG